MLFKTLLNPLGSWKNGTVNTHTPPFNVLFNWNKTIGAGSIGLPYGEKKKKKTSLLPHTIHEISLRWIVNLNTNDKTKKQKLLDENIEEYLPVLGVGKDSSDTSQKGKFW